MHGLDLWEARPRGEALGAEPAPFAAGRASHRKARDLPNAAPCTGSICGCPALGAKLFGHRAGAIRRGSRLPQKSMRAAQRSAMQGLNLWEARPRGEAVRAPSRRHSPRVAAPHGKARGLHKAAPPAKRTGRRGSAGQCGGYCDSTSVTAWRNTPVRSCGLPGSSRSIRSELPRQTSLPSFAS